MVDLQKIVDRWSVDKGSSVMLPWLGSTTCGEAATAIAETLRQIAELRADVKFFRDQFDDQVKSREEAEADKARLSEALLSAANQCDRWADESRNGGWSTHQVAANRKLADTLRRAALSGSGAGGWRTECATEGCGKTATAYFERGGVGSHYCHDCYMRVQALPAAPTATGGR